MSSNLTASAKFNVTEETNMLIPLPKELSFGLSKYGKAQRTRSFTVDVLLFFMAKSKNLTEEQRSDNAFLFAYRMGWKDCGWKNVLPKDKRYSQYVMDAAEKYKAENP